MFNLALVLFLFSMPMTRTAAWKDVSRFVERDGTNLREYNKFSYVCADFASDLILQATRHGLTAWSVSIFFEHEIGHVITAFQTADKGVVYVEPQTDAVYPVVKVGQPLCAANFCPGNGAPVFKILYDTPRSDR